MADARTLQHVTAEELTAYFSGQLLPEQESSCDEHFAECELCVRDAREFWAGLGKRVHAFSMIWDEWTADAHEDAQQRAALGVIFQRGISIHPEWQARLERWRKRWSGTTESVARSISDAATVVSRVLIANIAMSLPGEGTWRFALATESPSISSSARSGGVPIRGALAPNRNVSGEAEKPHERVTVSATGEVEVVVNGWQPGRPASLVFLVDLQGNHLPLVRELVEESAGTAVARFTGVTPGAYVVAVEPEE